MNQFERVAKVTYVTEKVIELKNKIKEINNIRADTIRDIINRTGLDKSTVVGFIDNDPYHHKLNQYQNSTVYSFLNARKYQPSEKQAPATSTSSSSPSFSNTKSSNTTPSLPPTTTNPTSTPTTQKRNRSKESNYA